MTAPRSGFRGLLLTACVFFSLLPTAGAQSTYKFESAFVIVTGPTAAEGNLSYSNIISDFVRATMTGHGVPVILEHSAEDITALRKSAADKDFAGLAEYARGKGGDFLLLTQYQSGKKGLELQFCIDAGSAKVSVSGEESAEALLLLDAAVARLVNRAIAAVEDRLVVSIPQTTEPDAVEESAEPTPPVIEDPPPVPVLEPKPEPAPQDPVVRKQGLFVSPAFGLFRSLGAAGEYFRTGLMPSVSIHYGFPLPGGRLSPGIHLGTIYFETEDDVAESSNFLSPFALDIHYTTASNGIMDFVAYLSGGGALFSVRIGETGFVSKIIPYAGGELGFLLFQRERVSLSLDAGFGMYFEKPKPIFGYVIGISVQLSQK